MTNSRDGVSADGDGGDDDGDVDAGDDDCDVEWLSRQKKTQGFSDKCAIALPCFVITICMVMCESYNASPVTNALVRDAAQKLSAHPVPLPLDSHVTPVTSCRKHTPWPHRRHVAPPFAGLLNTPNLPRSQK
jgi:hypothetical protein